MFRIQSRFQHWMGVRGIIKNQFPLKETAHLTRENVCNIGWGAGVQKKSIKMTFSVAADKICAQRDRCVEHEVSKISENDFENFEYDFENENGFFKNAFSEMRFS